MEGGLCVARLVWWGSMGIMMSVSRKGGNESYWRGGNQDEKKKGSPTARTLLSTFVRM